MKNNFPSYFISLKHQTKSYFQPPVNQFKSTHQARDQGPFTIMVWEMRMLQSTQSLVWTEQSSAGSWLCLRSLCTHGLNNRHWHMFWISCFYSSVPELLPCATAALESTWKTVRCSDFGSLPTFIPHSHMQQQSLRHHGRFLHLISCRATKQRGLFFISGSNKVTRLWLPRGLRFCGHHKQGQIAWKSFLRHFRGRREHPKYLILLPAHQSVCLCFLFWGIFTSQFLSFSKGGNEPKQSYTKKNLGG